VFVKIGALDVDVGKGVNGGIRHEGVGDRGDSEGLAVVEGLVRAVGVRPLRH